MRVGQTKYFDNYEDACAYVRHKIINNNWCFEQKRIWTGAGCYVDINTRNAIKRTK